MAGLREREALTHSGLGIDMRLIGNDFSRPRSFPYRMRAESLQRLVRRLFLAHPVIQASAAP